MLVRDIFFQLQLSHAPPLSNFKNVTPPPSQSQIQYVLKLNMIWVGEEIY